MAGRYKNDNGKFQTDISEDVINEALKAVENHGQPAEVTLEVESPQEAATEAASEPPAEGVAAEAPVGPSVEQLQAELAQARQELEQVRAELELSQSKARETLERLKESHERALRATADLENYRRRAQKEKEEVQKFGSEKLLKDMLPVVDNLDRALEAARSATDFDSLRTGVAMTRKLFEDTLGKHGVKGFSAAGQAFDPNLHEAVQQVETAEVPANHVVRELMRGYTLNERLVRPSLVVVARPPPAPAPSKPEPAAAAVASEPLGSDTSSGEKQ